MMIGFIKPLLNFLVLIFLLVGAKEFNCCASQPIVQTLPGYDATLPFKLETGYIGVGENDEIQLFYYFIESENDPSSDPLFLWLTGGPGCSSFAGLVYEIGPLAFDVENFDGSLPSFLLNPYSWTKVANIIFLDSPVGAGFSYSNTSESYATSDSKAAQDNYTFLKKWLLTHPEFIKNRLFVAGDSYGGKIVPMVASHIAKGNDAGLEPRMNLHGYIVGNPVTDEDEAANERIPYVHRMALISDQQFECTELINDEHILEPQCKYMYIPSSQKPRGSKSFRPWLVDDDPINLLSLSNLKCRKAGYVTSYVWANDETVRESLHIREGTVSEWKRCNRRPDYEFNVESVVEYHQLLADKGVQALIYSGDHDMTVPYMSTLKWIRGLNISIDEEWRPWIVYSQVAGYVELYKNIEQATILFATVKGAGHTAPEYKPMCFEMVKRWISLNPL